jgi:SAM-dependent methyltransferase
MLESSLLKEIALVTAVRRMKIYSPPLYKALRRFAPEHVEGKDTLEYVESVYKKFAAYGTGASMKTLELGPGPNLGVSQMFAADGHKALALDIEDLRSPDSFQYESAADVSPGTAGREATRPSNEVEFVLGMAEKMPLRDETFDLIFSNACLEHVREVELVARENWRVLRKGGRAVHQIDMRDHRHFEQPQTYMRYGDLAWRMMNPITATGYQNRWRLSQYVDAYERYGFRVTVERKQVVDTSVSIPRTKLAPKFQDIRDEDLSVTGCLLVAEKP